VPAADRGAHEVHEFAQRRRLRIDGVEDHRVVALSELDAHRAESC
jgi:hypothetical protein